MPQAEESAWPEFEEFYRAQFPGVVGAVFLVLGDREDAWDVTQESFARTWLAWERVRRCFAGLGTVDTFAWSPDGREIVVDGVGAKVPHRLIDVESGRVSDFVFGDDPALLAAVRQRLGISEPWCGFSLVGWSPSGNYVFSEACAPAVFSASDGRLVTLGHPTHEFSEVFAWSPTHDVLAYAVGSPPQAITDLYLLDPATGGDRLLYSTGHGDWAPIIVDVTWSPSGRWLAVTTTRRTVYLPQSVRIIDVTGGAPPHVIHLGPQDISDSLVGWGR